MSHSHKTVKPGTPKKDGAGGKGTWGKEGSEYSGAARAAVDTHDPNYDSEDDEVPPPPPAIVVFKAGVANILDEYFTSGDAGDMNRALKELGHPELHHEFVKAVISRSLDLHDRERELASELLPRLFPTVSRDKVVEGFTVLLERLEDLRLDIPNAPELLSFFLARAVVDDILPPSFLSPDSADVEIAKETLVQAKNLTTGKSAAKRLAHIWGPSGDQSVKKIKERISSILDEYLVSNDMSEADKAIKDLAAPSFNYYVVKKAVLRALDAKDAERDKIVKLLSTLSTSGLISEAHYVSGFKGCVQMMDDIELDTPNAKEALGSFVQRSINAGFLPAAFTETYKQALTTSSTKKQQNAK